MSICAIFAGLTEISCDLKFSTHEDLQEQSRLQDLEIQDLLRKLDQTHTENKIEYWICKARLEATKLLGHTSRDITGKCL